MPPLCLSAIVRAPPVLQCAAHHQTACTSVPVTQPPRPLPPLPPVPRVPFPRPCPTLSRAVCTRASRTAFPPTTPRRSSSASPKARACSRVRARVRARLAHRIFRIDAGTHANQRLDDLEMIQGGGNMQRRIPILPHQAAKISGGPPLPPLPPQRPAPPCAHCAHEVRARRDRSSRPTVNCAKQLRQRILLGAGVSSHVAHLILCPDFCTLSNQRHDEVETS